MKKTFLLLYIFSCCFKIGYSQAGALDPLFGTKGIVKANSGAPYNYELLGKQMLLQTDGSIYVVLQSAGQTFIVKKRPTGLTDVTYGEKGFSALVAITPICAVFQPDGRIVVAGSKWNGIADEFDLVRYNINGSVDNTFNGSGIKHVTFPVTSIATQADGKIVVAGSVTNNGFSYFAVARFNINGTTDGSFSGDGLQTTDFGFSTVMGGGEEFPESDLAISVAIQKDGKIVVLGSTYNYSNSSSEFAIARYNTDANLDNTFGSKGKQTVNFGSFENYGYSLAFQQDGKIIAAGYAKLNGIDYDFSIARFTSNGSLDKTFSADGKQIQRIGSSDHYPNKIAIQGDGKIIVEGYTWNGVDNDFAVTRCNSDGSPDNTFDKDGKLITDFASTDDYSNSVAIQADGKILVEGYAYRYATTGSNSSFVIARYNTNGALDTTFDGDGKLIESLQQGYTVYKSTTIQKDGKIVAAGSTWNGINNDFLVVRYNTDGSFDNTFNSYGKQMTDFNGDDYANSVVVQSDGKIVVAGYSTNGSSYFAIARYNPDGRLDNTFSADGKQITRFGLADDFANAAAIQTDGKIVVGGYSSTGTVRLVDFAIARYNTDGTLDNTFSADGKQTADVRSSDDYGYSIAIQTDGKILMAGNTWNGNDNNFAVVRYNLDGSLDNTFSGDGKQTTDFGFSDDYANSIAIQKDGKIVVGGRNGDYGQHKIILARYNTDGRLDPTFSGDGMQQTNFGLSDVSASSIAILNTGKIVTGGTSNNNFAVARFNIDGSIDNSFSFDGVQVTEVSAGEDRIQGVAIGNNKLYAAGFGEFPGTFGVMARYLLLENKPPAVSITSPVNNASYTAPATITINATASDSDGTISSVKLYNGSTYLKTDFTSLYSYTLSNLPTGTYSFIVKATDNMGAQTTSAPVAVLVKAPNKVPVVSITSPANNASYTAPANIVINATASDTDGTISSVKFYNGTAYLGTDFASPYTYNMSSLPAGTYSLTAKATDNSGAQTISAPVTVSVKAVNTFITRSRQPTENRNLELKNDVSLSITPNPASNTLKIYTSGLVQNKPLTVSIISASGNVVKTTVSHSSNKAVLMEISALPSGMYIVKLLCDEKVMYKPFIKL